jgi:hypothetical protein
MFKTAMLNLLLNVGIFGSFVLGFVAYQHENYVLVFLAICLFVILLMRKIKVLRQIRNSQKP